MDVLRSIIASIFFVSVPCSAQAVEKVGNAQINAAKSYFATLEEMGEFSGAVLIAVDDRIKLYRAYGYADIEHDIATSRDDVFRIGSLTKPITASAVMIAIQDGKLELDSTVCDFLTSCPTAWQSVTIAHLLSHQSGIEDHFGDLEAVPVEDTVAELNRVLGTLEADEPLATPAGEAYDYSNFNYVLLAAVLENVYEKPWEDILAEKVFAPIGVQSISYDDVYEIVPKRVRGYGKNDAGDPVNIDYDDHAAYAAGGLRSTIKDFYTWSQAAIDGDLFSGALYEQTFTPYQSNYGFGWQIREFFDRKMYNHTGGIDGFSSHIAHYVDADLTIIVFSNNEDDAAILRACDTANLIFDWSSMPASADAWAGLEPRERCGLTPSQSG